jgi:hypothetical protein
MLISRNHLIRQNWQSEMWLGGLAHFNVKTRNCIMGLLGDFLEAFYGRGPTFQSLQAHVRREKTPIAGVETSRKGAIGRAKTPTTKSAIAITEMKFWAVLPDHVRVDVTKFRDDGPETTVEIAKGNERLKQNSDGSVEFENEKRRVRDVGNDLPTDYRRQFDRSLIREFFASLVLEQLGECKIAGRDCVRIRALPVPDDHIWPHWLPAEADEFEFAADLVFPSLLSVKGLLSGTVIESLEVVDVTFDASINDSVFACEPRAGQPMRTAVPITERITLEAALATVSFTVLLPTIGNCEGPPHLHYQPLQPDGTGENLTVFYHQTGPNRLWFRLRKKPDREMENELEWEEVEVSGRCFQISAPESDNGLTVLKFCQDGTWVEVFSDHSCDELLKIAESFEAVER